MYRLKYKEPSLGEIISSNESYHVTYTKAFFFAIIHINTHTHIWYRNSLNCFKQIQVPHVALELCNNSIRNLVVSPNDVRILK
jgi:hypothetical protein